MYLVAGIIQDYLNLQLEDSCASSELFLSAMFYDYRDHKLGLASKLELRMHLSKRMRLYHKAIKFLTRYNAREFAPPKGPFQLDDGGHDFACRSKLISKWTLKQIPMASDWGAVRNLVIICMTQAGVGPAEFDLLS